MISMNVSISKINSENAKTQRVVSSSPVIKDLGFKIFKVECVWILTSVMKATNALTNV